MYGKFSICSSEGGTVLWEMTPFSLVVCRNSSEELDAPIIRAYTFQKIDNRCHTLLRIRVYIIYFKTDVFGSWLRQASDSTFWVHGGKHDTGDLCLQVVAGMNRIRNLSLGSRWRESRGGVAPHSLETNWMNWSGPSIGHSTQTSTRARNSPSAPGS